MNYKPFNGPLLALRLRTKQAETSQSSVRKSVTLCTRADKARASTQAGNQLAEQHEKPVKGAAIARLKVR